MDLILSSGFMAFSRHLGFLEAIEQLGTTVDAVVGTSSGALVGAMWWSGMRLDDVGRLLTMQRPLASVGWNPKFWQGPMTMAPVIDQLRAILPSTFEGLKKPFAVGVTDAEGQHRLLNTGPLPEAVAASCAVPMLFRPVRISGQVFKDGGATDGVGVDAWRAWRGDDRVGCVHQVEPTPLLASEAGLRRCTVIKSPKAQANFLWLKDFHAQADQTRRETLAALTAVRA